MPRESPPPPTRGGTGHSRLDGARGPAQILAMLAIGILCVIFAPLAVPLVIWIRLRDRRH